MSGLEQLLEPPEFEKVADIFVQQVKVLIVDFHTTRDTGERLTLQVEKTMPKAIRALSTLQDIMGDEAEIFKNFGLSTPGEIADEMDIQSANRCDVEVYASGTNHQVVADFVRDVREMATASGAQNTEGGFTPFSTNDIDDGIDTAGGGSMAMLYFTFS